MANVTLLVSGLAPFVSDVNAALPRAVEAFKPFGVNIVLGQGLLLSADPGTTASGWTDLLQNLTEMSARAGPQRPAHIVFSALAASRDPTINGELKLRSRGVCTVYLAAHSFQHSDPNERIRRIAEVTVHELGHLLNLTHSDGFMHARHSCSMMPSRERHMQHPAQAWALAVKDAADRREPPLHVPASPAYYPFAAQCRTILREAAFNRAWWPWESAFRGSFDEPGDIQDSKSAISLTVLGEPLQALENDGIALTLALRTNHTSAVELPLHIGVEFSNLRITIRQPDGDTILLQPEGARCSDATFTLQPGATTLRSFSLLPQPDEPIFPQAGTYRCAIALLGAVDGVAVRLGSTEVDIEVKQARAGKASRRTSARIISAVRGNHPRPSQREEQRTMATRMPSILLQHARYKLACSAPTPQQRTALLEQCMDAAVPTAIRHRAARFWAREQKTSGISFTDVRAALSDRFASEDDEELFETLDRMEDGWKILTE